MYTKDLKSDLYLSEDKDIMDELVELDVGKVASRSIERLQYKMSVVQVKAILRNRKTAVDLDKSNKKFSLAVLFIATVQLITAVFSFAFEVVSNPNTKNVIGGSVFLAAFAVMVYFFYREFRKITEDDKPEMV